ncbi:putative disease resistance RPP13-like protein 1 [Acorus gramineus]|uniref:Disease resistance RPP13-like protein 1 n=1 Tax=Acorus gramineus TaxID=55184 RepID=A0AAV9AYM8_ACOGR|nr:putative disease resistance RPP13-like protein 1 [Acorus gramineus]
MGAVYTHEMKLLSDDDGLSLLHKVVSGGNDSTKIDQSMNDVGIKIVQKCKGLPLAIKIIGGVLRKRKITEPAWKLVLSSDMLSTSSLAVKTVLQFSYLDLPSYLKPCFLYCTLFPEDCKLTRTKLSRMWIAEGFVKADGELSMEDLADSYYEELVTRCLLQVVHVSTIGCSIVEDMVCKVHDLVREMAVSITQGEHISSHFQQGSEGSSLKPRRSSTISGAESVKELKCIPLRSLLAFDKTRREIPQGLFGKLKYLRVLDLSMIVIEELPDSIGKLAQLRYLNISFSIPFLEPIRELPDSLCNLQYLQTLNIQSAILNIVKLPNSLRRLQRLRHLTVEEFLSEDYDVIVPAGIGELIHLQTLNRFTIQNSSSCYNGGDDEGGCSNIHELGSLSQLRFLKIFGLKMIQSGAEAKKAKIKDKAHLRTLELWWDRRDNQLEYQIPPTWVQMKMVVEVFEELCPPPSLQELYVNGFYAQELPSWMRFPSYSLQNLVHLRLNFIRCLQQLPSFGHLPNLECLRISKNEEIVNIGPEFVFGEGWRTGSSIGISRFPKLETLSFRLMWKWTEWMDGMEGVEEEELDILPRLRNLRLELCHELRSLPMGLLRHASNLTNLHLEVNVEGGIGGLVHVRELSLKKCYKIESLSNFPALQSLKVRRCYALKDMTNLGATSLARISFEFDDRISDFPGNNLEALKSVCVTDETLLYIEGPIAVLTLCVPQYHGSYWPVIKRFPHVQAKEEFMIGNYFTYNKATAEPIICQPLLPPPQLHQV